MNKQVLMAVVITSLLCQIATADDRNKGKLYERKSDKERIYKVEFEPLWIAAIAAAKEHFTVDQIHKEEGLFTFTSGAGFTTHGFNVNVAFSKDEEGGTRIKLNFYKRKAQLFSWGAGGNIADKFFKSLDEALAKRTTTQ
jgi:hypothetical protein